MHQLNHAHWAGVTADGVPVATPDTGVPSWREAGPVVPAQKDTVKATPPAR